MAQAKLVQKVERLIQKGYEVLKTHEPPRTGFDFQQVDQGTFSAWQTQCLNLLEANLPPTSPYVTSFRQKTKGGHINDVKGGIGTLEGLKEALEAGDLVCNDNGDEVARSRRNIVPNIGVVDESDGRDVFIGHGQSLQWRVLKDFIQDRLKLGWIEFNRDVVAGIPTTQRLQEMLDKSSFALLVMTAEDEHPDHTAHARENVVHEIGLFQGRLGFQKAIILLEKGCSEFSNIHGLSQIRFSSNDIASCFEDVRRVLEREGIL